MFSAQNEIRLIDPAIKYVMEDYVSLQVDIDETKIKAAALVAQEVDLERILNYEKGDGSIVDNLERCINPETDEDKALLKLIIPCWCYYTYYRCLKLFRGTFTDSGYIVEDGAKTDKTVTETQNEYLSIADVFMRKVIRFLEAEDESRPKEKRLNRTIRAIGGHEYIGRRHKNYGLSDNTFGGFKSRN